MGSIPLLNVYVYLMTCCFTVALLSVGSFRSSKLASIDSSAAKLSESSPFRSDGVSFAVCLAGVIAAATWSEGVVPITGHSFAWKYSLVELPAAYPFLCAAGFTLLVGLTILAKIKATQEPLLKHAKAAPTARM